MRWTAPMLLFAFPVWAQAGNSDAPVDVERVCGKLVHYEQIPLANNAFKAKTKNLPHIAGRIYRANEGQKCCEGLPVVGETQTGRFGDFEFKNSAAGLYWLVFQVNGRDYKFLIRYAKKSDRSKML
jgi:hypothetical protein